MPMADPRPARRAASGALAVAACCWPWPRMPCRSTVEELTKLCAEADDAAHCGRLVEGVQLQRLPNLAVREQSTLRVSLYPSGTATFTDTEAVNGGRSYSLWDFMSEINAVVLYVTDGDDATFTLLQRATGRKVELPADPKLVAGPGPSGDRGLLRGALQQRAAVVARDARWRAQGVDVAADGELVRRRRRPGGTPTPSPSNTRSPGAQRAPRLARRLADTDWVRAQAP